MVRTTPPRPVDLLGSFPELAAFVGQTVRLHPRPGRPAATDSSVGGPLLWLAQEPWPMCAGPHVRDRAFLTVPLSTIPGDPTPNAMIPVAQIFARDLPSTLGLPGFGPADLLQVLWCPVEHPGHHRPEVRVVFRQAAAVAAVVPEPPPPSRVDGGYTPVPFVLHPELVPELPTSEQLPGQSEPHPNYQYDLSVAPGWKLGGWAPCSATDPHPITCGSCDQMMLPLLTIASSEWDGGNRSWIPVEDQEPETDPDPVEVEVGCSQNLQLYVCRRGPDHPIRSNIQ